MNYDEIENVEGETETISYPKNNIVREDVKKRRRGSKNKGKALDIALIGSVFSALAAVVMLMTTVVSMALDGVLGEVFRSLL